MPPVPAPPERDLPLMRFIATVGTNGIGIWPRQAYETPVQRRTLLGRPRITVSDPEAVRRVLVENAENYVRTAISIRMLRPVLGDGLLISEGAAWRHQRRTLAPAFTPRAVEMLAPHILAATDVAIRTLEGEQGDVDLFGHLQRLALEIAGRTMFSVGMTRHGAGLRALVEEYQRRLGRPQLLDFLLPLGWPSPHDIARARFRRRWTATLDGIIADRGSGRTGAAQDLLDLLGEARDPETGRAFAPEELRDQVATLILAGHETTALTLLWACTLLAQAPAIQEALSEEALNDPGMGDLMKRLPLTRAVVDETLRLYPPAFVMARLSRGADTLAGHDIAAGTIVIIAPWLLHRHRLLWRAPDAFDPSRFLPGAEAIPRFAYLPFGAGPRVCIGAQFALTEAVLALSRLVARFRLALAGDRPVLPAPVVTLQPDHAPAFRLTLRGG
ncbi:cytochrome P450 [Methylobacterium haplocladii]|uniref:Cytochrome P450 n=1 Tax=Methylobacterium haplocladii TaxID=1176176 RepID=A0A512IN09_9HYPH|nr:cytochrome P450 [Methylobacterium haplocladii]GLS58386.1 cytochrome P450 [Methylobacterium haplocladii]